MQKLLVPIQAFLQAVALFDCNHHRWLNITDKLHCFPNNTSYIFYLSMKCFKVFATKNGCKSLSCRKSVLT